MKELKEAGYRPFREKDLEEARELIWAKATNINTGDTYRIENVDLHDNYGNIEVQFVLYSRKMGFFTANAEQLLEYFHDEQDMALGMPDADVEEEKEELDEMTGGNKK